MKRRQFLRSATVAAASLLVGPFTMNLVPRYNYEGSDAVVVEYDFIPNTGIIWRAERTIVPKIGGWKIGKWSTPVMIGRDDVG